MVRSADAPKKEYPVIDKVCKHGAGFTLTQQNGDTIWLDVRVIEAIDVAKNLFEFENVIVGKETIHEIRNHQECPECGKESLSIDGYFATGIEIKATGHKPQKGELIKNNYMKCSECTFEQWS